jgi:hypothetical protein
MAKNTVLISSAANIIEDRVAAGTITPGMLVERDSSDQVQAHSTAGGIAEKLFAMEDFYQGNGLSTDYTTSSDRVPVLNAQPGDIVYAMADDTTGVAIAKGDFVESAGDGRLQQITATTTSAAEYPNSVIGVALESAINGSRFLVKII